MHEGTAQDSKPTTSFIRQEVTLHPTNTCSDDDNAEILSDDTSKMHELEDICHENESKR